MLLAQLQEADALFGARKYDEAKEAYLKLVDGPDRVEAMAQVARCFSIAGKLDEGQPWLDRAREAGSPDEPNGWSRYLGVRGIFERERGDRETAKKTFVEMLDYCERHELWRRAIDAVHHIAIIDPDPAWGLKGIAAAEKLNDIGWLAVLWNNLGATYEDLKQFDKALDAYLKAREYHHAGNDDGRKLAADWAVAHALRLCGRLDEAKPQLESVVERGDAEWAGYALNDLGELYAAQGRRAEALGTSELARRRLVEAGMEEHWPDILRQIDARISGLIGVQFTHLPVDVATLRDWSPFYNYDNTSHAEGPRKWYLYGPDEPIDVYLPVDARLVSVDAGKAVEVNGETCRLDVNARFRVNDDVTIFFMHLCFREEIKRGDHPAGTHIGYVHFPPWNSLDVGVEDARHGAHWLARRSNPYDYFTPELQKQIRNAYAPMQARMKEREDVPYSDITDSRRDVDRPGELWGIWFRADLRDPFGAHWVNWAIVNFMPADALHAETWRTEADGVFAENGGDSGKREAEDRGRRVYAGGPFGRGNIEFVSPDVMKLTHRFDRASVFVKYAVDGDRLRLQQVESAEGGEFTEAAVEFRRGP